MFTTHLDCKLSIELICKDRFNIKCIKCIYSEILYFKTMFKTRRFKLKLHKFSIIGSQY